MHDGGIVAATLAGDPAALIDAYDQYAPGLYAYCRSMLSRPADAADAVQDTFVVAAAKLGGLRDPGRLRPWLFAVARNECWHQLDGPRVSRSADDDDMTMISERIRVTDSGQPGQQELISAALATLSQEDREILDLSMRYELRGADLGDVLGVPARQARLAASRARTRFGSALDAVLAARPGLGASPELTRSTRSADELLGGQPAPMPPSGLRFQVRSLLQDTAPGAVAYCAEVAQRAEPFTRSGFPAAVAPVSVGRRPASFIPVAGLLIALLALLGGGAVLVSTTLQHAAQRGPAVVTPPASVHAAPTVHTPSPGHRHGSQGARHHPRPTPAKTRRRS